MRVLDGLERYYDAVPRSSARVEEIGALTLFIMSGPGLHFYARPALGSTHIGVEDVERVRSRQRVLDVPQAFEWVAETTPTMLAAMSPTGLAVARYPLMVLREHTPSATPLSAGLEARLANLDDDFALLGAVAPLAFGAPGTAIGPAGAAEVRALAARADLARIASTRDRVRRGLMVMAVGFVDGLPVGIGVHSPVGRVTEVAGVGVVPAFRRRGIASALTSVLVAEALQRGIRTVFLSAGNPTSARLYERLGFERVGTACVAEPPSENSQ
ncbi:MAG TPA: GNAT family N-acetyltransferase [Chloroflexota bacterium]|nr:GNAT family N-acetyltransferase [Chloroflexota bacterium]